MTNDLFADAIAVDIAVFGGTYTSPTIDPTGFGTETGEPYDHYNTSWWVYIPQADGTATIDTDLTTGSYVDTFLRVYSGTTLADLSLLVFDDDHDAVSTSTVTTSVTAGTQYYIQVGLYDLQTTGSNTVNLVLRVVGPNTSGSSSDVPVVHGYGHLITPDWNYAPVVSGHGTAFPPGPGVSIPVVSGHGTAYAASLISATITAERPADGDVVPGLRPFFAVDVVTTQLGLNAVVEYDTDPAFPAPVAISTPVVTGQAVLHELLRAASPLTDGGTYYWRAYVGNDNDRTDYTATRSFTVSSIDGDAVIGAGWEISRNTRPIPHLWFVHPSRVAAGQTAIAHGTGFGPTTATVSVNGVPGTVHIFAPSGPGSNAYTALRAIIPGTGFADPYHQIVSFTVPAVDPPGGVLYIDGS